MPFRVIPDKTIWYESMGVAPLFNALVGGESLSSLRCPYPSEGQNAALCQILCRSFKALRRFFLQIGQGIAEIWPFFDFQDAGRSPSWISKVGNFNGPYPQEGQNASPCQIFMQIGRTVVEIRPFLIFQDGGRPPSWICYTPVWTTHEVYFGGLCHGAKFGLNRCSIFDNMQVLIF